MQQACQIFQRASCRKTQAAQSIGKGHDIRATRSDQRVENRHDMTTIDGAQHLAHAGFGQHTGAKCDRLIGQRQGIAHRTSRRTRQQAQRAGIGRHRFSLQHCRQMSKHRLRRHRSQIELQATRQDGDRHLLRIRRGEHEFKVIRRLFQRLQHRIEGGVGQHMDFVDHVDLEAAEYRLVDRLIEQLRNLLDTPIRCGVQFDVVDEAAGINVPAGITNSAGRRCDRALAISAGAIQALGQNPRHGGLADAACACEQIGMVQALLGQGIGQRLHDMFLPDQLFKIVRAVFARKDQITHGTTFYGRATLPGCQEISAAAALAKPDSPTL